MYKSGGSSQVRSGLGTFKRDWSTNKPKCAELLDDPDSDAFSGWSPSPPSTTTAQSVISRLENIQTSLGDNITSSQKLLSSSRSSQKRGTENSDHLLQPSAKKRVLPASFADGPLTKTKSLSRTTSKSSRSFAYPKPQSSSSKPSGSILLSQEQNYVLKLAQEGKSLFYTGSAGTGKSVLLREIIKALRKKFVSAPDAVAVTASTGIAACNIGGMTIHSFAGIGLGREKPEQLADRVRKNKKASSRWMRTKVLIIDEVSMVDGDLFDKISKVGTIIRKHNDPFGGIQLIVTGDFFQLPPVAGGGQAVKFAFEAQAWSEMMKKTINLTQVFRQRDEEFVRMLNEMRFGKLTPTSIDKFKSLSRPLKFDDGIVPTELFPRRDDVERSNTRQMESLSGESMVFQSLDGGTLQDKEQREKQLANFMAPRELKLKVNSQVMLIKNMDDSLVNGSIGKVLRFADVEAEADLVLEKNNETKKFGKEPPKKTSGKIYPVVEFLQSGGHKRIVIVQPESWKVELPSGEVQVSRTQLPLILSWAMSIHKSQGQTLERVKVDLSRIFEKGQTYVALSRATTLDGLQVLGFNPSKVQAHGKVITWSRTLEIISQPAS